MLYYEYTPIASGSPGFSAAMRHIHDPSRVNKLAEVTIWL